MRIVIKFLTGPEKGKTQEFSADEIHIGRASDNDIVFNQSEYRVVSRRHASIRFWDGQYILFDNDSANRTYVNGAETKEVPLKAGDVIMFGPDGPEIEVVQVSAAASLTFLTGPCEGDKRVLSEESLTVGRDDTNAIVLPDYMVSRVHARIEFRDGEYWIIDEHSKNGTYLDNRKIDRAALKHGNVIRFGFEGPEVRFECQDKKRKPPLSEPAPASELNQRRRREPVYEPEEEPRPRGRRELIVEPEPEEEPRPRGRRRPAYEPEPERAGRRRNEDAHPKEPKGRPGAKGRSRTQILIQEAVNSAVKRWKVVAFSSVVAVIVVVLGVVVLTMIDHRRLSQVKETIEVKERQLTNEIQTELEKPKPDEGAIKDRIDQVSTEIEKLKENKKQLMARWYMRLKATKTMTVDDAIDKILRDFGAPEDSLPRQVRNDVVKEILQYKPAIARINKEKEKYWPDISRIFVEQDLDERLGYIAWVESKFNPTAVNEISGATGMWQFMTLTARDFKLTVDKERNMDDRTDFKKSTKAAAEYIKYLMNKVFSGKHHFLLVVASYNCGQGNFSKRMREELGERTLVDNIRRDLAADAQLKNPDSLYYSVLLRCRKETQDYIPRFLAAVIINTEEFMDLKEIKEAGESTP